MAGEERILQIILKARDEASKEIKKVGDEAGGLAKFLSGSFKNAAIVSGAALAGLTVEAVRAIDAFNESEKVIAQTEAVLKSTGGVAGVTADQVSYLAGRLQYISGVSDEAIQSGENLLLTFTQIGKDVFPDATRAMLDMSVALGQDVKNSAIQLGKALNDPIQGVTALRRVGVSFSEEQQNMIKSLVESGRLLDAQKLVLKELQLEFGGSAEAAGKTFAGSMNRLKNSVNDLEEEIGKLLTSALAPMIGKFQEVVDQIKNVMVGEATLKDLTKTLNAQFGSIGETIGKTTEYLASHKEVAIAVAGAIAGILSISVLFATAAALHFIGISAAALILAGVIGAVVTAVGTHLTEITNYFIYLRDSNIATFQSIYNTVLGVFQSIIAFVTPIVTQIVDTFMFQFNTIAAIVTGVFNAIWFIIQYNLLLISADIQAALILIDTIWRSVWGAIGPYVQSVWNGIVWFINAGINSAKQIISTVLESIKYLWETQWKGYYNAMVDWFGKTIKWIEDGIEKVKNLFRNMATGIENIIKNIHIPSIHLDIEQKDFMGQKISVPKIGWYEQGGFVPNTGLAMLHAGEFVLSREMLAGREASPMTNNSYGSPITLGPVYVQDYADVDTLVQRLGFYYQTAGNI